MLISARSSTNSLSLIVSLLTNRSPSEFEGKYRSYCKDTGSIPVKSPLNPDVRCFIIKTLKHSVYALLFSKALGQRGEREMGHVGVIHNTRYIPDNNRHTHLNLSSNTCGYGLNGHLLKGSNK